ncbi:MAG: RNA methyltransferase [Candidatus Lambdaproteobacteria bacterium]|nr:RNA methyltransferase [Candidatus Lambdaproteobacteria bacterium]
MTVPSHLPPDPRNARIHVVLVEPGNSLNVGAVARAMLNLGYTNLHLVAPPRYDPVQAAVSACWAGELLHEATEHATLDEALADMQQVVGFTARHGRHRPRHLLLHEWAQAHVAAPPGRTALLFGPEDHGLTQEQISQCHWLVRIPTAEANPSLNLAQAVLLALYELSRPNWAALGEAPRELAPMRDMLQLDRLTDEVLRRSGFIYEGTPRPLPDTVKHLLRRIAPDRREMSILLGIFGKLNRVLQGRAPVRALEGNPATGGDRLEGEQPHARGDRPAGGAAEPLSEPGLDLPRGGVKRG